jgi:hypothetical protein
MWKQEGAIAFSIAGFSGCLNSAKSSISGVYICAEMTFGLAERPDKIPLLTFSSLNATGATLLMAMISTYTALYLVSELRCE